MERINAEQHLSAVVQLLLKNKLISEEQVLQYNNEDESLEQTLIQHLSKNSNLSTKQLTLLLAEHFGMPYFDLDAINIETVPYSLIDEKSMRHFNAAPLYVRDNHLFLAIDNPAKRSITKEIQFQTGLYTSVILVEAQKLHDFIDAISQQRRQHHHKNSVITEISPFYGDNDVHKENSPIVKFVNHILFEAIQKKASDIHFEPYEDKYRIRYRLDGLLVEMHTPEESLASRIASRLKILANLDITERRIPQDGRFKLSLSDTLWLDCRVNICPTINGEKIVIRLLHPEMTKIDIEALGFNESQKSLFLTSIKKPQGMILITGPTGSGKTISLYSALELLNSSARNISTVEDPVEIKIPGINQVNINPKIDLTFANALRAFLRQDPDIIMVGEIRDLETAEIAIRAAHTGHLVFSTLHTNSAAETLIRLKNIGIPSFNITSAVSLIMAQRLVRRLCNHCKRLSEVPPLNELFKNGRQFYCAQGCNRCHNGYQGRIALFELLPITDSIANLIHCNANSIDVLNQAQKEGMITMYQSGLEKIIEGLTTLEELNRVVND